MPQCARCIGLGLLVAAACWCLRVSSPDGKEAAQVTKVSVTDIGKKVIIIGRLGEPLREIMSVQGRWAYPDQSQGSTKDYSLLFHVTHVKGRQLDQPVVFATVHAVTERRGAPQPQEVKPREGETWELRAYETGGYCGEPDDYWKEYGGRPVQYSEWGWGFVTTLEGVLKAAQLPGK